MKLVRFKSRHSPSPYAPIWDFNIGVTQWEESLKIDTIREFLLNKEEYVLSLPYQSDGQTGLGKNKTTTRYGKYHILDWVDECPEIQKLFVWVRSQYMHFISLDATEPMNSHFTWWYNILTKGDSIKKHSHCSGEMAYLSWNMHLDNCGSYTYYDHMNMVQKIPNVKGGLTFFPGYVNHGVPTYSGDAPRVSIASDLYPYMPPYFDITGDNSYNQELRKFFST